jgi:uncharacterized membrane protein
MKKIILTLLLFSCLAVSVIDDNGSISSSLNNIVRTTELPNEH